MSKRIIILVTLGSLIYSTAEASTEFLRFKGAIRSTYNEWDWGYDASLGLVPGQPVYFDFQVDTEMNVSNRPDGDVVDYFAVTYLRGSLARPKVTFGIIASFPEGRTSQLFIPDDLSVGISWDWLDWQNPSDKSITTWNVGEAIALMNYSYFDRYIIGDLTMSYRAALPPPPIPIPPTVWLLIGGLGMMASITLRLQSRIRATQTSSFPSLAST